MSKKSPLGARTPLLAGGAPSWEKKCAFSARRAPSPAERASYLLKKTQSCAKRTPFQLCWRRGRGLNLAGAIIGEKALLRGRGASLLERGKPYLLRRAPSRAKWAPFRIRRATLLARRHPYNPSV